MKRSWLVLLGLTACVPQTHATIEDARRAPEPTVVHASEEPEKRTIPFHCSDEIDVVDRQFTVEAHLSSKASGPGGYMAGEPHDEKLGQSWVARVLKQGLDLRVTEQTASEDSRSELAAPTLAPWPLASRKELAKPFSDFIGAEYDDTEPLSVRLTPSKAKTPYANAKVMDVVASGTMFSAGMGHGSRIDTRSTGTMTFTNGGILLAARIDTSESMIEWSNALCSNPGDPCTKQLTRSSKTTRTYRVVCVE